MVTFYLEIPGWQNWPDDQKTFRFFFSWPTWTNRPMQWLHPVLVNGLIAPSWSSLTLFTTPLPPLLMVKVDETIDNQETSPQWDSTNEICGYLLIWLRVATDDRQEKKKQKRLLTLHCCCNGLVRVINLYGGMLAIRNLKRCQKLQQRYLGFIKDSFS